MLRVTEILPIIGLLMMLSGSLCTAIAIAFAESTGRPRTFDREMYWSGFASAAMIAGIVAYFGFRAPPRGISQDLWAATSLMLTIALTGVSLGCALGIFTYRRPEPKDEGSRALRPVAQAGFPTDIEGTSQDMKLSGNRNRR